MTTAYDLKLDNSLLHGLIEPMFVNDQSESALEVDAMVASGDSFITLATQLDQAADLLEESPNAARPQIEKAIKSLLYLQRNYKVIPKTPDHRQ